MGSGPACFLNEALEVGEPFAFEETADRAVLVLETRTIPDAQTCQALADQCGVQADHLALLIAPTASLAGSVQIAARSIETALHKLHHLGFGLQQVIGASGRCPIAIPTGDDRISMGRTNDLVIFASQVWLGVTGSPDAQLAELAAQVPSSASPDYGQPFSVTLEKAGDFYAIDPGLFAPAEITLSNLDSGRSFHHGKINQQQIDQVLNVRRSE
jgi:methenyltetrahydromethanopterin cyclohydrolase